MPTYNAKCPKCEHEQEYFCSMSEREKKEALPDCEKCQTKMENAFTSNNQGNYSYKRKDECVRLFYSCCGNWTSAWKGKQAAKLTLHGDDYYIKFRSGRSVALDVCELAELVLLTKAYDNTSNSSTGIFNSYSHAQKVTKK